MHGWELIRAAGVEPAARLDAALRAPQASQAALLAGIVERNAGTAFGRRHGFSNIRSVAEFRATVPVMTYEDHAADIEAAAHGEPNRLTADPVIAFERTGGTASGGKPVPYTARALAGFRAAVLPWLHDLCRLHPGIMDGTAYVSISPATRQAETTAGNIPIGLDSDAAYLGEELAAPFAGLLAVPPDVGRIADVDAWRLETLAHLVADDRLTFVSVWSPTFFLALLDAIPVLAPALAPRLDADAARRLDAALSRDPSDATILWPRLCVVSCWADAASSPYAARLRAMLPQAVLQPKGLLATEAAMTVPYGAGPGSVPALTSCFLEFRDAGGSLHLAGELTEGDSYDIIATTEGGFYRYDIGDRVRCIAKSGPMERMVFEGRAGTVSDMVGEKLDEPFVARLLSALDTPAMLVARPEPSPRYELRVDGLIAPAMADALEAALCANPQYAYARRMNQLGPLRIVADPGLTAREVAASAAGGQRIGDIKPPCLKPPHR
ncbi:MAG: GH3 auxin-responsive promoter family protein [Brucellaceae bacterium]|nr:GH3 auxin-responsive promoter family protein [Brucellaceae bacterium]